MLPILANFADSQEVQEKFWPTIDIVTV